MKRSSVGIRVLVAFLVSAPAFAVSAQGVKDSVKVSEFGYDPADSTEFIRKALASGAKKVILDRQSGPWYTLPVKMPSNIEFVLEPGVELVAKRGEFRHKRDYLVELYGVTNVTLRGGPGSAFRMWKCDYQKPPYEKSEWRYALRIVKSVNVLVEDLRLLSSGGDGIGVSGENITIRRCVCDDNHRQGMSVFSVRNLLVEDTVLSNTCGTPPQAGLDIEPDHAHEGVRGAVFRNCTAFGNKGNGFEMYLAQLTKKSGPVDILFENCRSWSNNMDTVLACTNLRGGGHVTGSVRYVNCSFGPSRKGNAMFRSIPAEAVNVSFTGTVFTNTAKSAAVKVAAEEPGEMRPDGIAFNDLVVHTDGEWFRNTAQGSGPVKDVTGEVTIVSSDGSRRTERIDAAWVERNIPAFDGGRPLPPPAAVPAADAVEVFDASPGELAETEPFTVLSRSVLVFFAEKPGPCRFVIRQVNMVPGRALSKRPLIVEPIGGGRSKEIAAPGEKPIEVVYHAAKRGFYKVVVPRWGTRLRIDSTSVPLALHAARPVKIAAMKGKPFALTFGIDGSPFTFFAKGGDYYRFKVQMFDTAGGAVESRDIVKDQFTAHEKAGECAGFRKVIISRAAKPHYDHISLQLFGGEGFFFLTDKKRWR